MTPTEVPVHQDGRIILSWGEKIAEKGYALRAAIRIARNGLNRTLLHKAKTGSLTGPTYFPDGSALVCWMSGTVESGEIKVRRILAEGTLEPASGDRQN